MTLNKGNGNQNAANKFIAMNNTHIICIVKLIYNAAAVPKNPQKTSGIFS